MTQMNPRIFAVPFVLAATAVCWSQEGFLGKDRFPQFRNISGLSGGTFGVLPSGAPSIRGAMAISTPIGYSLTDRWGVGGLGNMGDSSSPRFFDTSERSNQTARSNGTGFLMMGFPSRFGAVTVGGMLLSSRGDTVLNLQWQAPARDKRLGFGVGVQDAFSTGGSAGDQLADDGDSSRSLFAVGTYEIREGLYATAGLGTRRFANGFASVSAGLGPRARGVIEYDGFGWNAGAAYDLGPTRGARRIAVTLFAGLIRGKNSLWGANFSF